MLEPVKAQFSFNTYKVKKFSYSEPDGLDRTIKIKFEPAGKYDPKDGVFIMELQLTGHEESDNAEEILKVISEAQFKFPDGLAFTELPDFFYKNAIAIFFPYLRSFVSTMTLQANTSLLILDIMNLSNLEQAFKDNTIDLSVS